MVGFSPLHGGDAVLAALAHAQLLARDDGFAGEVIAATNGHVWGRTADGPWEVRKAVRELVQAGVDFIKTAASGGFYRRDESDSWHPYLMGLNSELELRSLKLQDNEPGLLERAALNPLLEISP